MKLEKIEDLVEQLNELKIIQNNCWEECIPEEIFEKHFLGYKEKGIIDRDENRWYELGLLVVSINNSLIGINCITKMYSESCSYEDMCHTLEFFELEEIKVVSYKKK